MARKKPTTSPADQWRAAVSVYDLDDLLSQHLKKPPAGDAALRKRWLFAVAGGRLAWDALPVGPLRDAVEVGERAVDGKAKAVELKSAAAALRKVRQKLDRDLMDKRLKLARDSVDGRDPWGKEERFRAIGLDLADTIVTRPDDWGEPGDTAAAINILIVPFDSWDYANYEMQFDEAAEAAADVRLAVVFRDIVGNPFDPVPFDKKWLTSAVVGLATAIHDERSFEKLPILADALEEAGCGDARILSHCRDGGEHAKGCWVIDGLFGRNWVPRAG